MKTRLLLLALALGSVAVIGCKSKQEDSTAPPPGVTAIPGPMGMTQPQMVAAGKDIFIKNCARCHGATGQGAIKGAPNFASPAWQQGESDAEIADAIKNGKAGKMPAWDGKLSPHDQAAAAAFVRSLAGPVPGGPPMPGGPPIPGPAPQ